MGKSDFLFFVEFKKNLLQPYNYRHKKVDSLDLHWYQLLLTPLGNFLQSPHNLVLAEHDEGAVLYRNGGWLSYGYILLKFKQAIVSSFTLLLVNYIK